MFQEVLFEHTKLLKRAAEHTVSYDLTNAYETMLEKCVGLQDEFTEATNVDGSQPTMEQLPLPSPAVAAQDVTMEDNEYGTGPPSYLTYRAEATQSTDTAIPPSAGDEKTVQNEGYEQHVDFSQQTHPEAGQEDERK